MSLRNKAIKGFIWSSIDSFAKYFLTFFIGIILARLLNPLDYGLIGMTSIFVAISKVFIDGGFSDALIRKSNLTDADYSSVFIFNIFLSVLIYIILYSCAPIISGFFNEPKLVIIIRIVGVGLIINAFTSIQSVILKKRLDFKIQAIIGFTSTFLAGCVAVIMAYNGFGVWSLVFSGIVSSLAGAILIWILNNWRPKLIFNLRILKEHFSFGSKIMGGSLLNVIYDNIFFVLIGKLFSPIKLGYYAKADNFQKLLTSTLDIIIRQVTYPVLSIVQHENHRLKSAYQMMIKISSFIIFLLLFGLAVIAKPLIITLIGAKWMQSVIYLQLLCFVGVFYPLISINNNILNVKGRSDLSLLIMILKFVLTIPAIILGLYKGILFMIVGMIGASISLYLIIILITSRMINYSFKEQLKDILSSFIFTFFVIFPVYLVEKKIVLSDKYELVILLITGFTTYILVGEMSKNTEYIFVKEFIKTNNINFKQEMNTLFREKIIKELKKYKLKK